MSTSASTGAARRNGSTTALEANGKPSASLDYLAFTRALSRWFATAQRDLPWRRAENARDPYRVLVSEVMLQQTTVAAVIPYYERFIARFPTVASLADASLEEVLPLWAGLGYYGRARLLHRCAAVVQHEYGGGFPRELTAVAALPGIGRYTAGAVTSIAHDLPAPIVDANVTRLFSRLFLIEGDLKSGKNRRELWRHAESAVQSCAYAAAGCNAENTLLRPSVVNPALMELGALVCTPRSPRCEICPVAEFCAARAAGRQNELPHLTPKRQIVELRDVCVFLQDETVPEQVLLRQRPHDARVWWRGLWELPRTTCREDEEPAAALDRLLRDDLALADSGWAVAGHLKTMQHGVTHHRITLECYSVSLAPGAAVARAEWFGWDEIEHLALPSTMRSLVRWLRRHPSPQPTLW